MDTSTVNYVILTNTSVMLRPVEDQMNDDLIFERPALDESHLNSTHMSGSAEKSHIVGKTHKA